MYRRQRDLKLLYDRGTGHFCRLGQTHHLEHGGSNVAQLAALTQGAGVVHHDKGHRVGGVGRERLVVLVQHLVCIAVIGVTNSTPSISLTA